MARTDPQVNVRMPAQLKDDLENAAYIAGRSLTAEIVLRLQQSFLVAPTEAGMLERRAKDIAVLRGQLGAAISEVASYETRRSQGQFGPYGPEWLDEVIEKKKAHAALLTTYLENAERDVANLLDLAKSERDMPAITKP